MQPETRIGFDASAPSDPERNVLWCRSRSAWRFMYARYVPLLMAGNLVWEILQLPFYTIWHEGTPRARLFAILHCTTGDVMIGTAALLASVMLVARRGWPRALHVRVLGLATITGVAYTIFSEWVNTQITMTWQYAESMPQVPPLGTGLTPLLQWLVVPPLAYCTAVVLTRMRAQKGV